MLLRDRLIAALAAMGDRPDHQRLAADVLGIRNAPAELARRLVAQALVVEDRREAWLQIGERICAAAPGAPGVYILRDAAGNAVYVGKANNLRRRLRTHFAGRRWRGLKAGFARAVDAEWIEVGSELEALLREAEWIARERPAANVQVGPPELSGRALPATAVRDVVVVLPSCEADSVELVAARADGPTLIQRTRRNGRDLAVHARRLRSFFTAGAGTAGRTRPLALAPIVFSWLAGRGDAATRLDPHDAATTREFERRISVIFDDPGLFAERIVVLNSGFRLARKRP